MTHARTYKGFTLTARTFQVRGTGRWTQDVLIGRHGAMRSFAGEATFLTEQDATIACWLMGRRIIDRSPRNSQVVDLADD